MSINVTNMYDVDGHIAGHGEIHRKKPSVENTLLFQRFWHRCGAQLRNGVFPH